ncbi:glycosyltransferase family 4 protein, partial [bacterium]|nr:glycosyltransferase family 4 protein [bacterium]
MSKDIALIFHPFFYDWEKYPIRGIDRYNYELLRNYKKMGIDPSLLDSGYVKNHIDGIVKEIVFPFKLIFNGKKLYHATHPMGAKWAILTRRRPLITTIHDLIPFVHQGQLSDWGLKYKMKSLSIIWAAKYSDHVIVPFKSSKDMLVNDYNIDPNKISIVNYGIDHQKYFPVESKKVKDHKTIFFVGELAFAKGVDTLIKATGELIRKDQNIELVLG